MSYEISLKQANFIDSVNATVLKNGKKSLKFKMEINDGGGALIDMVISDEKGNYRPETILLCLDSQYVIELKFSEIGKKFNLKSKVNSAAVDGMIDGIMSFYS